MRFIDLLYGISLKIRASKEVNYIN